MADRYGNAVADHYELAKANKDIDVAIFGSSHAFCSYNPMVLDTMLGIRSFNYGNIGQRIVTTDLVIKERLKEISPKLIVIDIYEPTISRPDEDAFWAFQKNTFDRIPFSINKLIYAIKVFEKHDLLNAVLPVLRRKDFSPQFNKDIAARSVSGDIEYKGYLGSERMFNDTAAQPIQLTDLEALVNDTTKLIEIYRPEEKNDLFNAIARSKDSGADVLLVVAPYYFPLGERNYASFRYFVDSLSRSMEVNLLDLNYHWHELGLTSNDFKDYGHMNSNGASKASAYLAKYIEDHYQIPSRENDMAWLDELPIAPSTFISNCLEKEMVNINKTLNNELQIIEFTSYRVGWQRTFIWKVNADVTKDSLEKYKLGFQVHVMPNDSNIVSEYSKSKGRNFDAWDHVPQLIEVNGDKYLYKEITTAVDRYEKLKLFLYDRNGYDGVKGKVIEILDRNKIYKGCANRQDT